MKIRHTHHWHLAFGCARSTDELGDAFTARGLAKAVGAKKSTIYGLFERGIIPADHVEKEPQTGMYLIRKMELCSWFGTLIANGESLNELGVYSDSNNSVRGPQFP